MVVSTEVKTASGGGKTQVAAECPRSPDGKHKFEIGGRVYHFCAYCNAEIDKLPKKEVLEKLNSTGTNIATPQEFEKEMANRQVVLKVIP